MNAKNMARLFCLALVCLYGALAVGCSKSEDTASKDSGFYSGPMEKKGSAGGDQAGAKKAAGPKE